MNEALAYAVVFTFAAIVEICSLTLVINSYTGFALVGVEVSLILLLFLAAFCWIAYFKRTKRNLSLLTCKKSTKDRQMNK